MQICSSPEVLGLRIAGISLSLESFLPWKPEAAFLPFVQEVARPDFRAVFRLTDTLPQIPRKVVYEGDCYRIHPQGEGRCLRSFFDAPRRNAPYGVAEYDWDKGLIQISCMPEGMHCISDIHNSFFHIDFESMLMEKGRLCLHAACVATPLGGILFSGPSGIGKTTQAELWCAQDGVRQINGDRPILSREPEGWLAWGAPYAGSSGCHVNDSCPVSAIVMLGQGRQCRIDRLKPSDAFREVWAGLTVHSWDRNFMERAVDLTLELVSAVPVYRFVCTPDVSSVEYLRKYLGKDLAYGRQENSSPPPDGLSVSQGGASGDSPERNL